MAKKQQFDVQTLLKHHYWIVAALAGILLPVFWYLAVGGLAETLRQGHPSGGINRANRTLFAHEPATTPST